jgi:hypothetical protein
MSRAPISTETDTDIGAKRSVSFKERGGDMSGTFDSSSWKDRR